MLDTNAFIAAFKSGWTRSTDLLLELLTNPNYELVGNRVLLEEYERWAHKLGERSAEVRAQASTLIAVLRQTVVLVEPEAEHIERCRPHVPEGEYADLLHAATCLRAGAVLISNDRHFDGLKRAGIVEVWSISEAIRRLLGCSADPWACEIREGSPRSVQAQRLRLRRRAVISRPPLVDRVPPSTPGLHHVEDFQAGEKPGAVQGLPA